MADQIEMFPEQQQQQDQTGTNKPKMVDREYPKAPPEREALVKQWQDRILRARSYHKDAFKQMREDMQYATMGCNKEWEKNGHYRVPIVRRHINNAVSVLYAKNPQAVVKAQERIDTQVWSGDPEDLRAALDLLGSQPDPTMRDPQAMAIVQEAIEIKQRRQMIDKVARTLQILYNYYIREPIPNFKKQFKQAVRRAKTCGVAYIKVGFQRLTEMDVEVTAQIDDAKGKIAHLERMLDDMADGEIEEQTAQLEELRTVLADLQSKQEVVLREGPIWDFPRSTEIIVDPCCRQLQGFIGAKWIAQEHMLTAEKVQEIWGVDIRAGKATPYRDKGEDDYERVNSEPENSELSEDQKKESLYCVWEVFNKQTRQEFIICDGYCDFVAQPTEPKVHVEGFWRIFSLVFNPIESEKQLFPPSDVFDLRHPQMEYNRSRQALREHRHANRPAYGTAKGKLDQADKALLQARPANAIIELNALLDGQKVGDVLEPIKPVPIDPALYDTGPVLEDVLRSVGEQEARLGSTSGATATESTIAEGGRMDSLASNVDDVDEVLTELARAGGQIMFAELSVETVKEIVGPGAVWPEIGREQIAKELLLEVKSGSTGRPNKAAELANRERAMPFLIQFPGISATPIAKDYLELLDINVEEAVKEGIPSIVALNAMAGRAAQPAPADPGADPSAQGPQGGNNAPAAQQRQQGSQPAYPGRPGQNPRGNMP